MKKIIFGFVLLLVFISFSLSKDRANIIVAKDGSGNFTTIQEAINSIPKGNKNLVIILVKNGIYREKILIQNSNIAIVGEDREKTRIVYPELRENWTKEHNGSDWGSAVVNIDTLANDITFANLTIYNNYGSIYDVKNKHQFTVRGWGTRIIFIFCNVLSDGGDTISLWNKDDGCYYHSNCYFEGWVDYVCPRGWCYITDSRFYGYNLTASIWHDGDKDKDQKFVIRYSYFDGVPGFPLGRHHRDGQFYLLDCIFSKNMFDRQIYYPTSPTSRPWKWGARHYYYNCHHEGGDFDWFKDNLNEAEKSPKAEDINALWTFAGKWDPESIMPAVMPYPFQPYPRDGSYSVNSDNVILKWVPARNAISHKIYFGSDEKDLTLLKEQNLSLLKEQNVNNFAIGKLESKKTYYWQIVEVTDSGTLKGDLWHFTTK